MNEPVNLYEPVLLNETDAQPPDEKVTCGQIARTGRVLRQAGIPHILWGWWAAACNGRKRSNRLIEFVVEDNAFQDAFNALGRAGFICRDYGPNSPTLDANMMWDASFVYMSNGQIFLPKSEIWGPILLHRKSSVLWWLSSPLPTADPSHELLIYGDNFEKAHYLPEELTPEEDEAMLLPEDFTVVILKPAIYAEALIKLFCRDLEHPDDIRSHWAKLIYEFTARKPSPLGCVSSKLEGRYRPFWDALCRGAPYMDEAQELRQLLYNRRELPDVACGSSTSLTSKPNDA